LRAYGGGSGSLQTPRLFLAISVKYLSCFIAK